MSARSGPKPTERGAALLAVLAMVVLLSGFASLGLSRLKAASTQIGSAQARAEAQLLASAGATAALSMANQLKARARIRPELLDQPVELPFAGGKVEARLSDAGNCFNLNSLARPEGTAGTGTAPAAARPADFARLLVASGIPLLEARTIAQATANQLGQTGLLWVDASEWVTVPGVTARHWELAAPLLCALPMREAATLNINSLTPERAPLLAGLGLGSDEARRAISRRPQGGWSSSSDFLSGSGDRPDGGEGLQDQLGISSRWMRLDIIATTPRARIARVLLVDTLRQPAHVVSSRWVAAEVLQ